MAYYHDGGRLYEMHEIPPPVNPYITPGEESEPMASDWDAGVAVMLALFAGFLAGMSVSILFKL